jgi:2-C-methyl-D-erythritol 2,4-cyclodiphosphate synthase
MRVGIGHRRAAYDPTRPLILGGLKLEGAWGLRGRGDGDVALLAVADAVLGAAGHAHAGGDASEPAAVVLAESRARVRARGFGVVNVDLSILAPRPDLEPHLEAIVDRVASLLGVDSSRVAVKQTAPVGFEGEQAEGIVAFAVALLESIDAEPDA